MKIVLYIIVIAFILLFEHMVFAHPMNSEQITYINEPDVRIIQENNSSNNIGFVIGNCLVQSDVTRCLKKRMIERLVNAIKDNEIWQLNDYITIEKNPDWKPIVTDSNYNDVDEMLIQKFEELAESRSLRVRMATKDEEEGRKKKDKGGMALMGGVALVGMMAQLFMGKIVMIAGVALVISKIALLFSVLNALKKAGHSSEHVVYSGAGGNEGNWQRSIPRYNEEQYEAKYPIKENSL